MIKITVCSLSFRSTLISLILVSFWFILPYFVVIFPCSGIFRFIPVYCALFVCHSGSFRYIPVPFLFIPSHSSVILPHCGIFRYVPFHSFPFLFLVTPCWEMLINQRRMKSALIDHKNVATRYLSHACSVLLTPLPINVAKDSCCRCLTVRTFGGGVGICRCRFDSVLLKRR